MPKPYQNRKNTRKLKSKSDVMDIGSDSDIPETRKYLDRIWIVPEAQIFWTGFG